MNSGDLTQLEQATLEWVSLDYENVETICDNISEAIGREVPKVDVYSSLISLHKKELVEAYLYDPEARRFVLTSPEKHEITEVWWLQSKMARKQDA